MEKDARPVTPNGNAVTPNGRAVTPNGRAVSPNGRAVTPNGRPVTPNGRAVTPNGRAVTPNGLYFAASRSLVAFSLALLPLGLILLLLLLLFVESGLDASGFVSSLSSSDFIVLSFAAGQATASVVLSVIFGVMIGWSLYRLQGLISSRLLITIISLGAALPPLALSLALVSIWGRQGWFADLFPVWDGDLLYGIAGIILGHMALNVPLVARVSFAALRRISEGERKMSSMLCRSAWERFRYMEWPYIWPTVRAIGPVVFLLSLTSFALVQVFGGSLTSSTLELEIYEAFRVDFDLKRATSLTILQLAAGVALAIILGHRELIGWSIPRMRGVWFAKASNYELVTAVGLLLFAGSWVVIPIVALVISGVEALSLSLFSEAVFYQAFFTSVAVAFASAILACSIGFALALALWQIERSFALFNYQSGWADRMVVGGLSALPLILIALPSLAMALCLYLLFRKLGIASLGPAGAIALVLANALASSPFAVAIIAPAFSGIGNKYDRLMEVLDMTRAQRFKLVYWPGVREQMIFVFCLSFTFSLGDFGAVALFGNESMMTMPYLMKTRMSSYQNDDAAGIALVVSAMAASVFLAGLLIGEASSREAKSEEAKSEETKGADRHAPRFKF